MGSGAIQLPQRERLMQAARRRAIGVALVRRLDRWERSGADLLWTLRELDELGIGRTSVRRILQAMSCRI